MWQQDRRLPSRLIAVILFCYAGILFQRIVLPTNSDLGIVFAQQFGDHRAVALDPTATQLAIVDGFGGVRIISIADGLEQQRLPAWEAAPMEVAAPELSWGRDHVAFSPDGQYLAQWGQRGVRIWALDRRQPVSLTGLPASPIGALAFLADGQIQVRATIGGIYRWRLPDSEPTKYSAAPLTRWATYPLSGQNEAWAFAGQGQWVLACTKIPGTGIFPDLLTTISTIDGQEVERTLVPEGGTCVEIAPSPDGTILAVKALGERYYLLDWRAGRVLQAIHVNGAHNGGGIAFSPDGSRVFLGGNKVISIHSAHYGYAVGEVRALSPLDLSKPVSFGDIQVSPDGQFLLALCGDLTVRIWRVDQPKP